VSVVIAAPLGRPDASDVREFRANEVSESSGLK
jgi:hypothetical protein